MSLRVPSNGDLEALVRLACDVPTEDTAPVFQVAHQLCPVRFHCDFCAVDPGRYDGMSRKRVGLVPDLHVPHQPFPLALHGTFFSADRNRICLYKQFLAE